jgi:hypothetical protein
MKFGQLIWWSPLLRNLKGAFIVKDLPVVVNVPQVFWAAHTVVLLENQEALRLVKKFWKFFKLKNFVTAFTRF